MHIHRQCVERARIYITNMYIYIGALKPTKKAHVARTEYTLHIISSVELRTSLCCSKNSGKLLNLCVCFMHFDSMRSRCAHISKNCIYKHSPAHKRTQNPFVQKNGRNGAQQKGITKHIVYMQTRMAAAERERENSWACSSYSIYLNNCCRNNTYADDVVCTTNPMHFKCSMVT